MRSPRPKGPRNPLSGDCLATRRAGFGSVEPKICLRAAVYGTEGQRFESSRARYTTRKIAHICRNFVPSAGGLGFVARKLLSDSGRVSGEFLASSRPPLGPALLALCRRRGRMYNRADYPMRPATPSGRAAPRGRSPLPTRPRWLKAIRCGAWRRIAGAAPFRAKRDSRPFPPSSAGRRSGYVIWLSSSRRARNWANRSGPSCCAQAVSISATVLRMTRIAEVPRRVSTTRLERKSSGSGRRWR
jgi:hypothetical protein